MPIKNVSIEVDIRDPETNEYHGTSSANGTTADDGVTVTILNGYVPTINAAAPADIRVHVQEIPPPPVLHTPAQFVSRVDDAEANTSVITFDLTP